MVKASFGFLLFFFSSVTAALECLYHPIFIHEFQTISCELIDSKNAAEISRGISPSIVAKRYKGAVLHGVVKRVRQLNPPELGRGLLVQPWEKSEQARTFLFRSKDKHICYQFPKNQKVTFATVRNCDCDRAVSNGGNCILIVDEAFEIPGWYQKWAE